MIAKRKTAQPPSVLEKNAFQKGVITLDGEEIVAVGYDAEKHQVIVRRIDLSSVPAVPVKVHEVRRSEIYQRALHKGFVEITSDISATELVRTSRSVLFSSGSVVGVPYFRTASDGFHTILKAYLIRPNEHACKLWPGFNSAVHLDTARVVAELEPFPEAFEAAFDKVPICEYTINSAGEVTNVVLSDAATSRIDPSSSHVIRRQVVVPFWQKCVNQRMKSKLNMILRPYSDFYTHKDLKFHVPEDSVHNLPEVRKVIGAIQPVDVKNVFPDPNKLYTVKSVALSTCLGTHPLAKSRGSGLKKQNSLIR